jgi:hypothetical protein
VTSVPARRLLVLVGWSVTPVVAWAAAFLGGWVGARVGGLFESAKLGFVALVAGAAFGALLATGLCLWTMRKISRRSRELRERRSAASLEGGKQGAEGKSSA